MGIFVKSQYRRKCRHCFYSTQDWEAEQPTTVIAFLELGRFRTNAINCGTRAEGVRDLIHCVILFDEGEGRNMGSNTLNMMSKHQRDAIDNRK